MWMRRQLAFPVLVALSGVGAVSQSSCRRDEPLDTPADHTAAPVADTQQADILVFPASLNVEDASVNEFVHRAMNVCARGEYDAFRLLFSARENPLARGEFETGWQAVQEIRIRALEKVKLAINDPGDGTTSIRPAYALLAEVQLDPRRPAGKREPHREVVLMIVREHGGWRLGNAPKSMCEWIKKASSAVIHADSISSEPRP